MTDGTVFIGGGFGSHEFYAFDAESGKPRWAIRVSDDGPTAAVVAGSRVVFNTESCTIFVVDARTGRQVWSRWLGDPLMSQPAVAGGTVFMAHPGADGHRLIRLALDDGKTRWEAPIQGDIISAPVIDKDAVYLATHDGTVYRFERESSKLVWKEGMHATSAPSIDEKGEVHVARGEARGAERYEALQQLSGASGAALGEPSARKKAAPAWAAGKVVVGTTAGSIEAYEAESGKRVFSIEVGDPVRFQPALVAGRVFVGTERGTLVSVATGDASLDRWTMWGGGPRHNGAE